jgi:hypothetical protein
MTPHRYNYNTCAKSMAIDGMDEAIFHLETILWNSKF